MAVTIRSEVASDAGAIEAVTIAAFSDVPHSGHNEQCIVNELRRAGALAISLVAELEGRIVGHVAISPITVSDGSRGWYGLGPLSVEPRHQGRGVGSALITRALNGLKGIRAAGCVVLGDPKYYGRFDFKSESSLVLPGVPSELFQAIRFRGAMPVGTISYHEGFNASGGV